ncbi:hypothetical protein SBOR_6890 [Sclerotinia borealis F-4128]|uniref:DUF3533 domain-containing protein n=1 Tax=Sclerotinia borealis (strain F-4128) TaxID=1432307 RepID=W9CDU4_SCLBF|nr:hypothetical protein SBOR_6890 [Sclerotinia borealis F-4128]
MASDQEEKGKEQDTRPVGFWDRELNTVRKEVLKKWAITTLILSTFILAILSLYWGALFRVEQNMSSLVVWVVDFDGQIAPYTDTTPIIGPQIVSAAEALIAPSGSVGWGSLPASHFNYDPMEVRKAVYNFKAWAAIIINANATALLQNAVQNGNTTFDPMGIAQTIYVQARDETTHANYITPQLLAFQSHITSTIGSNWTSQVLSQAATNPSILTNLRTTPQALSPAIGFSTYNLRPFFPPVATPAVSIGLIYLIIISFFSFSFYLPVHTKYITPQGHRPMHFYQLILWRWLATIIAYFFLSLFYSLISLAFQIPFSSGHKNISLPANPATAYGKGTFVVYWMLNWVGMAALGLACENVTMVVGQPWTAFWLVFWVITNVSTSFYLIDLAPGFYGWGYAWPLHNIVEASRQLLFDLHSRIGLNFGVLFVWVAINTALFPVCCYFMRWNTLKGEEKTMDKRGNAKEDL